MSKHPAKIFPYCLVLTGALFLCLGPDFCLARDLTGIQKEAQSYRETGLKLQNDGKLEDAVGYYRKAIAMYPEYPVTYNDAGIVLEALGEQGEAKRMYLKAIEVDPDYPNSYSNLAIIYEQEGNYSEAAECWTKRASLGSPDDPWAEAARRRLGDISEAYPDSSGSGSRQKSTSRITEFPESYVIKTQARSEKEPLWADTNNAASSPDLSKDNKTRAFNYLADARENFARGNYVAALKEATMAEYLDPEDNPEISAFVEEVRKKLLR